MRETVTIFELAETMHRKLCHLDHIEYCTWDYEIGRAYLWHENAHRKYLEKATKLRKETPLTTKTSTIKQILESL
jgi:hypothetical protein